MHRIQGSHGDEGSGIPSCDSSACMVCEDKAGLLPYIFPIQVPPKARPYLLLVPARRGPQPSSSEPSLQSTALSHDPPPLGHIHHWHSGAWSLDMGVPMGTLWRICY